MAVVSVGVVWMTVFEPFVPMRVRVRFARRIIGAVFVLMVFIVAVPMLMDFVGMHVGMRVGFRYVQPHAYCHKNACCCEPSREGFMQDDHTEYSADKWRG